MSQKAQGTIEYLVILAVVVVIALIVVSILIGSTAPGQNITSNLASVQTQSAPISITEAVVNPDGEAYLLIGNNTAENITIHNVPVS